MPISKIERLISKFLSNSISANELDQLATWVEKDKNSREFAKYAKINYAIIHNMTKYDIEKSKKFLRNAIMRDRKAMRRIKVISYLKYAAVVVFLIAVGYGTYHNLHLPKKNGNVISAQNQIVLELQDGSIHAISEYSGAFVKDLKGNNICTVSGDQLVYHKNDNFNDALYNTLKIPNGKQFQLLLADGTKVHLNSGSTIKFPVNFVKDQNRNVYLSGEAFFEVSKDKEHPFIVNTDEINVGVFGTEFVVSSYKEGPGFEAVLVEGSVGLFKNGEKFCPENTSLLQPSQKAVWHPEQKTFYFEKVDTDLYTGWMDGKVIFDRMLFKNILLKLERHYNVSITNDNEDLGNEIFTGSFDEETIEEVFQAFRKIYPMKFSIEGNKVSIN